MTATATAPRSGAHSHLPAAGLRRRIGLRGVGRRAVALGAAARRRRRALLRLWLDTVGGVVEGVPQRGLARVRPARLGVHVHHDLPRGRSARLIPFPPVQYREAIGQLPLLTL